MENDRLSIDFENRRLAQTLSAAQEQLALAQQGSREKEAAIISSKQELLEDASHRFGNLYSQDGFFELLEFNQYAHAFSAQVHLHDAGAKRIHELERMLSSPYFARVDVKFVDEDESEEIYIGRSSLRDEKTYETYVYDWRAPISSIFYRFALGPVFYDAPAGRIEGEVSLKRQYEIHAGKLEYFFDADIQIVDEFLRKMLAQNTSSRMKTIVETIQRDQDIVIRDLENDLMMVQGVAGSGKTSIALHRAAYLMYQGLASRLSAHNIVIVSPNTLFEQYISGVLPDLGEENVLSVTFEEIFKRVLGHERMQGRNEFLERVISHEAESRAAILKSCLEFKTSGIFREILNRFIQDLPHRWIKFEDVLYAGKLVANRHVIKSKILSGVKTAPLAVRLKQLEAAILKTVHELRKARVARLEDFAAHTAHWLEPEEYARLLSIRESTVLLQRIRAFTELDCFELYGKLFHDKEHFYRLAEGLDLPENIGDILDFTCRNFSRECLSYDDAAALAFLHLRIYGSGDFHRVKQVVVDEAQDYYPLHFELLNLLFPRARYTVLGDVNQTIGKREDLSLYGQIREILRKKKSTLITMDKSFRCTNEILRYSAKFLDEGANIQSFNREGDVPEVRAAQSIEELDGMIASEITYCKEYGYRSIALICKTEKDANALYERLKGRIPIRLVRSDSVADFEGTLIMPVYMSKGLEFDAVLVCDVDLAHYSSEEDKKLLYVACTRALHRLNLFCTGTASPLLPQV